jgi:cullin 1
MMILLLFNRQLSWTVEQIQDGTQIQWELLLQILWGLLKNKLLICADFNEYSKEINIKRNSNIQLATDFKR